ncbi:uncharacterized protein LOC141630064 [Silene latifolia]|uniref:uncharacterized protein LOC141630064 n=1 Tax=Silene latifolia TaxID=37657 RepID=UPI003D772BD8
MFNPEVDFKKQVSLMQGLRFPNKYSLKKALIHHAIENRGVNKKVSAEYLAERYLEDWRLDPKLKICLWKKQIKRDLGVDVKYGLCWLARARAKLIIYGNCSDQYGRVWDYVSAVGKFIPGSTAIVVVDNIERPPLFFQRMYICYKLVKEGYLNGCRPIIGPLWLSGFVVVDGNNNIYPVAWAVVEIENRETWCWFLRLLMEDLGMEAGLGITIKSVKQKGIREAFNVVTPKAHIIFYVRHIWANFKVQFPGILFKEAFWKAARASTKAEFKFEMNGIKFLNARAYTYLNEIGASHWSRRAFNTSCKSNMLTNNMCESFNSVLKEVRDKPILTMMEWMRRYVMKRHYEKRQGVNGYTCKLVSYVEKFLKWAMDEANCCDVYASSDDSFEVEYMSK